MNSKATDELLKEFAPQLEHTGRKGKIWIGFLIFMIIMGLFALYWQVSRGHIVTGMRDNVV